MRTVLEAIIESSRMNGEWLTLTPIVRKVIRGTATAHELQVVAEHLDDFEKRMGELKKKVDGELIAKGL